MTNKKFLWGMLALALSFGMTVVGCDNGSGGGVEKGNLSGSTWKLVPGQGQTYTSIFEFTDGRHSYITTAESSSQTNYYTYEYSHELKTGTMENDEGKVSPGNWLGFVIFTISDDYQTLTWNNTNRKLKYNRQ
jgi:hypothetical protein